jgi:hypothetical protein
VARDGESTGGGVIWFLGAVVVSLAPAAYRGHRAYDRAAQDERLAFQERCEARGRDD